MVYILFLVFDFMQVMAAIRSSDNLQVTAAIQSNDNLDRTECARLRRRDDVNLLGYLEKIVNFDQEKVNFDCLSTMI